MADWLRDGSCEMAAIESTISYWKPLYNILETSYLNAMVVNARHMKAFQDGRQMLMIQNGLLIFFSMDCSNQAISRIKSNGNWYVTTKALSADAPKN